MPRFFELFYLLILFIIFVSALDHKLDQEEHEADVKWLQTIIRMEVPELKGDCIKLAAESCANDYGGNWRGSVNCARAYLEENENCANV